VNSARAIEERRRNTEALGAGYTLELELESTLNSDLMRGRTALLASNGGRRRTISCFARRTSMCGMAADKCWRHAVTLNLHRLEIAGRQ